MRVLVTGATGFVGNYVVEELLKKDHEVIATSTSVEKAKAQSWFGKAGFIEYKIGPATSENLFTYFERPDLLMHLAWSGLPNYNDFFHIEENLFQQFSFIKNLVDNGLNNVLVTGTCLEYGMQNGALTEDMPTQPGNPYALAKDSLRKFLESLQKKVAFNFKWVRLFYMYGKGQSPKSLISLLDKAIANGDKQFSMSGGEQLRDYLKITEVAEILTDVALQDEVQGVINCCSGRPTSVRKLVEQYLIDIDKNIELKLGVYPYPDYEPIAFWGDNEKLASVTRKNS